MEMKYTRDLQEKLFDIFYHLFFPFFGFSRVLLTDALEPFTRRPNDDIYCVGSVWVYPIGKGIKSLEKSGGKGTFLS